MNKNQDRRGSGDRRWGMVTDFPLKDSGGILVLSDRRTQSDRRLDNTTYEDRLLMFAGMAPVDDS